MTECIAILIKGFNTNSLSNLFLIELLSLWHHQGVKFIVKTSKTHQL